MNKNKLIIAIVAILLGALFFVYGGYDDSPGAQLIGLIVAIVGVVGVIRARKKKNVSQPGA